MSSNQVKYVGAIDEGTSSARFIIFKAGSDEIVCYHQIEVPSIYPQEGWVEQDPMLLYEIVRGCIDESVRKLEILGGNVKVSFELKFLYRYCKFPFLTCEFKKKKNLIMYKFHPSCISCYYISTLLKRRKKQCLYSFHTF